MPNLDLCLRNRFNNSLFVKSCDLSLPSHSELGLRTDNVQLELVPKYAKKSRKNSSQRGCTVDEG